MQVVSSVTKRYIAHIDPVALYSRNDVVGTIGYINKFPKKKIANDLQKSFQTLVITRCIIQKNTSILFWTHHFSYNNNGCKVKK